MLLAGTPDKRFIADVLRVVESVCDIDSVPADELCEDLENGLVGIKPTRDGKTIRLDLTPELPILVGDITATGDEDLDFAAWTYCHEVKWRAQE